MEAPNTARPVAAELAQAPGMTILVAMPLIGRDAGLVPGWAAAVAAIAAAHPATTFTTCAAVRGLDAAAKGACAAAGVAVVETPWYNVPADGQNKAGIMLKRIRLAREAAAQGAAAIWYVNADIRPRPEHWAAVDALFRAQKTVAVLPYPVRWAPGHPPAVCLAPGGQPELHDARCFRACADAGEFPSAVIAGGSFGCTAIATSVVGLVPFIVREAIGSAGHASPGEDIGWFLNAYRAGIEVRMPLGIVVEHVGCEAAPLPPPQPPQPQPQPPPQPDAAAAREGPEHKK